MHDVRPWHHASCLEIEVGTALTVRPLPTSISSATVIYDAVIEHNLVIITVRRLWSLVAAGDNECVQSNYAHIIAYTRLKPDDDQSSLQKETILSIQALSARIERLFGDAGHQEGFWSQSADNSALNMYFPIKELIKSQIKQCCAQTGVLVLKSCSQEPRRRNSSHNQLKTGKVLHKVTEYQRNEFLSSELNIDWINPDIFFQKYGLKGILVKK